MKKLLCLLMALVLGLCLTGCASEKKANVTGEWYVLNMALYAELTEKRPESLDDLPAEFREFPEGTSVTFRALNERLTLIEMSYTVSDILLLAKKDDDGRWRLYGLDLPGEIRGFGGEVEGAIERWHSDVCCWSVGEQQRLLVQRRSVLDDARHLK